MSRCSSKGSVIARALEPNAIGRVRELTTTITGAVAEGDAATGERAAAADELWALRAEHADAPALSEDEVRGVLAAMSGQLAAIVAPSFSGAIIDIAGFRSMFVFCSAFFLLACVTMAFVTGGEKNDAPAESGS